MAPRRKLRQREAQLAFEAITIEGGLLSPEWLAKIAQLQAEHQTDADYRILKGLALRDEIGRFWRVAQAYWGDFKTGLDKKADPQALADRFLVGLLRESFGFSSVAKTEPVVLAGRTYPVGHSAMEGRVPVVIAPAGSGLDTLSPAFGEDGRRRSAFGLAQEVLNADEQALWGVACDGLTLRLCRDNASLTRPSWLEADLGRIFTEERYADFAALWLVLHESRFGAPGQPVTDCPLEAWRTAGREEGTRARDHLRQGVEEALVALGRGFLTHPDNQALRAALHGGQLTRDAYFQELLRLVYRVIFLLTAEERGVLYPAGAPEGPRSLYERGYGLRRLRDRAARRSAHDRFSDLWEGIKIVFRGVGTGEPRLALPALGGLFGKDQCPDLDGAKIENRWLLAAIFKLSWLREESGLSRVNWRDMGPEELGSVYESLLELVPQIPEDGRGFSFATGDETKGNARKTTGSYYTPDTLVQALLDSALEPVVQSTVAAHPDDTAEALLQLSVVDPACGSGHFLLGAARRLATHVARIQANGTPSAEQYRHAVRQVVSRCLFGVDLNPMAVELCRVSLWMEAVEPGRPLSFLDSHVRVGDSLLGSRPDLLASGIPDDAFKPLEDDDRELCSALKRRNKSERDGIGPLFARQDQEALNRLRAAAVAVDQLPDDHLESLHAKELAFKAHEQDQTHRQRKLLADAWCAAFVAPKSSSGVGPHAGGPLTQGSLVGLASGRALSEGQLRQVEALSEEHRFFHWQLVFPSVFASGGFDVVIGNPPWGAMVAPRAKPLMRTVLPVVKQGALDTFAAFTQQAVLICRPGGRVGLVLPDILLLKNYPALRLFLLQATRIEELLHWGHPFPGVSIDVCSLVVGVGEPPADHQVRCVPEVVNDDPRTSPAVGIRQAVFLANKDYRFNLRLSPETQALIEAMKRLGPSVGSLFTIREGVHSGNVREKLFIATANGSKCRPLIFGRDEISPMGLTWAGRFIQLDPACFDKDNGDYFNIGDAGLYAKDKILVRRTGDFVLAALDLEGRYCSNNFFIVVPTNQMPPHRLIYAAAALNSPFATLYFRTIQPRTGKLFAELKITHLEDIPIPFFGDAGADAEGNRLLGEVRTGTGTAEILAGFCQRLLIRIRGVEPQVSGALEAPHG